MEHKTQQELLRLLYEKKMPRNEILDYIISEGYFEQNNALHQYLIMTQNGAQINHDISDPRINVSLHSHEFYEIIYVRQVDNLEYLWGNNRYRINPGDIILIPPGVLAIVQYSQKNHQFLMTGMPYGLIQHSLMPNVRCFQN